MRPMPATPEGPDRTRPRWRRSARLLVQLALACAALIAVALLLVRQPASPGVIVERREPAPGIDQIRVHVSGAVLTPGVVIARPGERVADAIERAGGAAPDADRGALNLARRVSDEDHIVVPRTGEATRLLDLNGATQPQLEALPGIGPVRAAAIIAARAQAPFTSTDDLLDRGLVPANVYAAIRDLVATPGVAPGATP